MQYLQWLADRYSQPIVLVWDLFATDRNHQVQEFARELSIPLIFIPPGLTDECELLDRRVFENLHQCAPRKFDCEMLQVHFDAVCIGRALKRLVDV
jgi:hypothetical protein